MDSTCSTATDTCTGDSSSTNSLAVYASAALSTMGLSTILLMQLDGISRRILSPPRLLAKRRQEYRYVVEQSSEYNALMVRQHIGGGKGYYDPKMDLSSTWEKITKNDTTEMEEIIAEILDVKKPSPVIVAMEQDLLDDHDPNTFYLFLAFPPRSSGGGVATPGPPKLYRRVQLPLVVFCEELAKAFEGQMTSTALCFVVDASSGLGSETLTTVVKQSNHGVATISNPAWMTSLALLVSKINKTHYITTQQFERIIFSLCRLDAWRVRDSIGTSRTVLFSLPGQACVPLLLPLIQKVFVHERHVFVYDGCCHSVEMGMALRNQYGSSYRQQAAKEEWEEVSASPKVITSTFSMAPLRFNRELPGTLANLNGVQASIVESWMASVDVFLDMKSKEKKNFYTPFVCRMGFLMKRSGIGNGDGRDMSELALKNVLEYITGSKSRALPDEVMTKALSSLTVMRTKFEDAVKGSKLNAGEKILIEKCVFANKAILIGEKTLLDTVQPKEDWSLKAAKKLKSCMCCIPGEGDEEEEDEDGDSDDGEGSKPKEGMNMSAPGAFATKTRSNYIDGKAQFAFDPTMFN
eukprot:CAMPEP_0172325472 /NCGR_PEP_ID=MMETSP1058-20130122/54113_1 /TAXON_ID=83371 /ORGANISM="Detonula confervacea, Strain CCMP 353" /LENGTH=578 /DNA_ID=CAMNT_0013042023 /DNA_START=146 /DNA_END=1879 /DNA_ORIENTATION=-